MDIHLQYNNESNIIYFEKTPIEHFNRFNNMFDNYIITEIEIGEKNTIKSNFSISYRRFKKLIKKNIIETSENFDYKFNIDMYEFINNSKKTLKFIYVNLKEKYNFYKQKIKRKKKIITFLMKNISKFIILKNYIIKKKFKYSLIKILKENKIYNDYIGLYNNFYELIFFLKSKIYNIKILKNKKFNIFNYNFIDDFSIEYFKEIYTYIYFKFIYDIYFFMPKFEIYMEIESKIDSYSIIINNFQILNFDFNNYFYFYLFPYNISYNIYNFNNFEFAMLYNLKTTLIK